MRPVSVELMQKFLAEACRELSGSWILMGGALIPALGLNHRQTVDVDFVAFDKSDNEARLGLFKLCERLGLGPEAINPAGEFFLKSIPGWQAQLVKLTESNKVTIYRPKFSLFIKLKLARGTESDVADLLAFVDIAKMSRQEALEASASIDANHPEANKLKSKIEAYLNEQK